MSFTFPVCKTCTSSKINHFGTVLSIAQQPWFNTLRNNIPKHVCKTILLHFADYFSLGKCHLVLYQQSGFLRYFPGIDSIQGTSNQAHQEMIWNQFCSGESSGSATDTTKQTGAEWAVITLLSLPSTGVGETLSWSSLCPGFGHVTQHTLQAPQLGRAEKNIMKGSWIKIRTGRSLSNHYHRQNRLYLGKLF